MSRLSQFRGTLMPFQAEHSLPMSQELCHDVVCTWRIVVLYKGSYTNWDAGQVGTVKVRDEQQARTKLNKHGTHGSSLILSNFPQT